MVWCGHIDLLYYAMNPSLGKLSLIVNPVYNAGMTEEDVALGRLWALSQASACRYKLQ